MIKLDDFTYGFELEGVFDRDFILSVEKQMLKKKLYLDLKDDSSVNVGNIIDDNGDGNGIDNNLMFDNNDNYVSEVNIGVFDKFKDMLALLKMFENGKNYFSDESCGLHIHIKPKEKKKFLRGQIFDSEFIDNLQEYASLLCYDIKENRLNNSYCRKADTFNQKFSFFYKHL